MQQRMKRWYHTMKFTRKFKTCTGVCRTAYKIDKHGRPFTDMSWCERARVKWSFALRQDVLISSTMLQQSWRKKLVNDIIKNRWKVCVLIEIHHGQCQVCVGGLFVCTYCQRWARHDITETLLACLHKYGFDDHFFRWMFCGLCM